MDHRVIDTAAAEGDPAQNLPLHGPAPGKEIEGQRAGPVLDKGDGLLQRIKGQQREDRAKDLLLHHRGGGGVGQDQGGGHPAAAGLTAAEHLTALQQPLQTAEVGGVDDAGVVRA